MSTVDLNTANLDDRKLVIQRLYEELVGPAPRGKKLDCSTPLTFENKEDSYGPWIQQQTGDEILIWERPSIRYGLGVLYPKETPVEKDGKEEDYAESMPDDDAPDPTTDQMDRDSEEIRNRSAQSGIEGETDDLEITAANALRPSSMGISFLVKLRPASKLVVELPAVAKDRVGGRNVNGKYEPLVVDIAGTQRTWWVRKAVTFVAEFSAKELVAKSFITKKEEGTFGDLRISVEVYSRKHDPENDSRLVTVCLVNRSEGNQVDRNSLYQAYFEAHVVSKEQSAILPYPAKATTYDDEERSLSLLYRKSRTFAVGTEI